jgi:hypothetical protein
LNPRSPTECAPPPAGPPHLRTLDARWSRGHRGVDHEVLGHEDDIERRAGVQGAPSHCPRPLGGEDRAAQAYATIGAIGFEGRRDYGAIGVVTNLAARLCGEARGGQILASQRVFGSLADAVAADPVGPLALKGFHTPVAAFELRWGG